MIYNAHITSGKLTPSGYESKHPYAYVIRVGAVIEIAGSFILGLSYRDTILRIVIWIVGFISGVCIDALGEFLTMMRTMANQDYELQDVVIQIDADDVIPGSITNNDDFYEDQE